MGDCDWLKEECSDWAINVRVEHFSNIEKLFFAITSRIFRVPVEHRDLICRSDSVLYFGFIQGCWANPDDWGYPDDFLRKSLK